MVKACTKKSSSRVIFFAVMRVTGLHDLPQKNLQELQHTPPLPPPALGWGPWRGGLRSVQPWKPRGRPLHRGPTKASTPAGLWSPCNNRRETVLPVLRPRRWRSPGCLRSPKRHPQYSETRGGARRVLFARTRGSTRAQHASIWAQHGLIMGSTWAQHGLNMGSTWATWLCHELTRSELHADGGACRSVICMSSDGIVYII